jgi:hypothetical protein
MRSRETPLPVLLSRLSIMLEEPFFIRSADLTRPSLLLVSSGVVCRIQGDIVCHLDSPLIASRFPLQLCRAR